MGWQESSAASAAGTGTFPSVAGVHTPLAAAGSSLSLKVLTNSSVGEGGTHPWHSATIMDSRSSSAGTAAQAGAAPAAVTFVTLFASWALL